MRLFSITKRFVSGAMPTAVNAARSCGSTWFEMTTICTLPVSSTALGPMSFSSPRAIGPRFL